MRTRLATLAALGGIAVAVLPAHAATPKPQITDPSGDSAPGGAATDITGITLQTVFKKRVVGTRTTYIPTATKISLSLAGAPDTNTFYSISFDSTGSCKSVLLAYDANSLPLYAQNRSICADKTPSSTINDQAATVTGKAVVWTLPLASFPVGTKFSGISGRTETGAAPLVAYDATDDSKYVFTVGQK